MNVTPYPKPQGKRTLIKSVIPTSKKKPKKPKTKGICPQCAFIFRGTPEHYPHCSKEIPVIVFRKNKTERQMYKEALDSLCQLITIWRDGCTCVLSEVDGSKCSHVSNWGHVIPQGGSAFLVYELSNSFRQCASHNKIHDDVNPLIYTEWYSAKWGRRALAMLNKAQIETLTTIPPTSVIWLSPTPTCTICVIRFRPPQYRTK